MFFLQNYENILLSHFMPLVSFYTPVSLPENIRKPFGSQVFRGYRMHEIANCMKWVKCFINFRILLFTF